MVLPRPLTALQRRLVRALFEPRVRVPRQFRRALRVRDVMCASIGLIVTSPVLVIAAAAVAVECRALPLYQQSRVGRHGQTFSMLKLRTMRGGAVSNWQLSYLNVHMSHGDPRMWKAFDDPRVGRIAALVRSLKIDELPQLVNILRGEMSLVGPRPLTPDEDRHVVGTALRRRDVRPGLTGPWQVLGGNDLSMQTMLVLDAAYAERSSLAVDFVVALSTPTAICAAVRAWRCGGTG